MPNNNSSPDARHALRLEDPAEREFITLQMGQLLKIAGEAMLGASKHTFEKPDDVLGMATAASEALKLAPDTALAFRINGTLLHTLSDERPVQCIVEVGMSVGDTISDEIFFRLRCDVHGTKVHTVATDAYGNTKPKTPE